MKKYIMSKFTRIGVLKVLVIVMSLTTLAYAEMMVWNETVDWVSNEMVSFAQEDNTEVFLDQVGEVSLKP